MKKDYCVWINQNDCKGYLDENGDFSLDLVLMDAETALEVCEEAKKNANFISGYDSCEIERVI